MNFRAALCFLAAALAAPVVYAQPDSLVGQTKWRPLSMDVPRGVARAVPLGPKSPDDVLRVSLVIAPKNMEALQRFVDDVSNPASPNYRHFLSPEEVGTRFGVSSSTVQAAADFLRANGMKVRLVAKNRLSILADATVAQAERAFHTHLQDFQASNERTNTRTLRFAFTVPPSVPASLGGAVSYVGGLESFTHPIPRATLSPNHLRSLYAISNLYDGKLQGQGRTIGISNWDGYLLSNVALEYNKFNLPTPAGGVGSNISVVHINGDDGQTFPAQGEGDIDIQCALAMAPLCNLVIYDNAQATNQDLIGVLTQEADDNSADIISESYAWTPDPALFEAAHKIHVSMSAQGITYIAAAGDTGAEGIVGTPYPVEDPEVLTVGGTTATVDGSGFRLTEVAWNNSGYAGGGGWIPNSDSMNLLPTYQKGNGVPKTIPYRLVPDIALNADPNTGYDIFYQGVYTEGFGGTSCASPTVAGALADCEQKLIAAGYLTVNSKGKYRMGRIQDLLYSYNGDAAVFNDIVSGDIGVLPDLSTAAATPGWDFASGWGTPIFSGLVNRILGIPTPTGFTISPTEVTGGANVTGTLTVNLAAPPGGFVFTINSDSAQAAVPATATIPAGQKSTTFTFGTTGSASPVTASLTASASGVTLTAALTINPSAITAVSISPNAIVGGNYATGTVTLNGPAPAGGLDVSLSSDNAAVTVPQHVEIPAGSTSGLFSVASVSVSATITATVTASYNGEVATAGISVSPPSFASFSISPSSVQGGGPATGTVTMASPAPSGGFKVSLSSDSTAAIVPASATIPAGATSVTVKVSTIAVSATVFANVTASNGATSYTASLTINPAQLASVSITPAQVSGGNIATSTVSLDSAAGPEGAKVTLQSSLASVNVPASVTVAPGAVAGMFSIQTSPVASHASCTVTATLTGISNSATFTISPVSLTSLSVAPAAVVGGLAATGTAALSAPAPSGGVVIALQSSTASASVPALLTVPSGATSATFQVSTTPVSSATTAMLSGSFNGVTQTTTLAIQTPLLSALSISPTVVVGGNAVVGTITLARAAPGGGATVSLSSTSSNLAFPLSVTVASGANSATFSIKTIGVAASETDSIVASLAGTKANASVTLNPAAISSLTIAPISIVGGSAATATVVLSGQAPSGGIIVPVSSSLAAASVPAAVTIPAGGIQTTFQIQTKPVPASLTASISAVVGTTTLSANLGILPPSLSGISVSSPSVVGGSTQTLTATVGLSGPVSSMPLVLQLKSSNSKVLAIPATVVIGAGASSASFAIHHLKTSTAQAVTLSAVLGSATVASSVQVMPFGVSSITVSPVSLIGGAKCPGLVTLNATPSSASGGVRVVLTASVKSATVPASVTILPNTNSAKFVVATSPVKTTTAVKLTASLGNSTNSATLTINAPSILGLAVTPATVKGSSTTVVTGTATITGPAPVGGVVVLLNSSTNSATVPVSVTIAAGKTSVAFRIGHKSVDSSVTATVTATLSGASVSANLKLTP